MAMHATVPYRRLLPDNVSTTRFLSSFVQLLWQPARAILFSNARPARHRRGSFDALSSAIVGTSKQMIHQVFGPPPAAATWDTIHPARDPGFWQATVWYYPLNPRQKIAMAIEFHNNNAISAQLIQPPTPHL